MFDVFYMGGGGGGEVGGRGGGEGGENLHVAKLIFIAAGIVRHPALCQRRNASDLAYMYCSSSFKVNFLG